MRVMAQTVAVFLGLFSLVVGWSEASTTLPEGEGKSTVQNACTKCHSLDQIISTRKTQLAWEQTIDDMSGRGADISEDDRTIISKYLTAHFGKLNVNTATEDDLRSFLGFSKESAKALTSYRDQNGRIKNFDQLKTIPGIDSTLIEAKKDLIAFSQ